MLNSRCIDATSRIGPQSAVTYFVTFHLADSLPVKKLAEFEAERKRWLELNPPPHSEHQIQEYRRNFSQRIQKWLDAGYIRQRCASCPFSLFPGFPAEQLQGRSHCS